MVVGRDRDGGRTGSGWWYDGIGVVLGRDRDGGRTGSGWW
jgi:hypothetical protein